MEGILIAIKLGNSKAILRTFWEKKPFLRSSSAESLITLLTPK